MTLEDVVRELLQCLGNDGDTTIPWEQVRRWPKGAIEAFQKADWLKLANLAETVECPGCVESCPMLVEAFPAQNGQPMRAFVACEDRNFGKVEIPLVRLQQWRLSQGQLTRWISAELGFHNKPEKGGVNGIYKLGTMQGKERLGLLELDTGDPSRLKVSGHSLPLMDTGVQSQPLRKLLSPTLMGGLDS